MYDDEENCTPPEIIQIAKNASNDLLPAKSRERYETAYNKFMNYRLKYNINSFSENVLLAYFTELSSSNFKPSSLWAFYSMLRTTISIKHDVNIADYKKLQSFLKRKSDGYRTKKSKVLTPTQIQEFLKKAPDSIHLLNKVVLIFGINGACRKQELRNLLPKNVEDTGKSLIVNILETKTKVQRSFLISEAMYPWCKKYMLLRPKNQDQVESMPFFLNYSNEKCTKQCVGINKLGGVPKAIAKFLNLPDAHLYTGHCFRRSSATILVDSGGDLLALKRHGGWRSSSVAESYVDNSTKNKCDNSTKIAGAILNFKDVPSTSTKDIPSTTNINNENVLVPGLVFNNCSVTINNTYQSK